VFVVLFGACGTYLLLPHKHGERKPRNVHATGAALGGLALLLFSLYWSPPGPWISSLFFYAFSFASIAGGVLMITSRNPIHSALYFALVVLSTSGLFLLAGAQFLAAGTVIVYAGAIIVTFLFVIMLAQMEGRAPYDRAARMPFRATLTCFLLFLGLLWTLFGVVPVRLNTQFGSPTGATSLKDARLPRAAELASLAKPRAGPLVSETINRAVRPTARLATGNGAPKPHVAGLGETLYTDHLVVVELAGALLFVALIGALVIATPKPPVRPATAREMNV
jgi:NADH-quinone oxidoreductase subunit J